MTCPGCGRELLVPDDAGYCPECGYALSETIPATVPVAIPETVTPAQLAAAQTLPAPAGGENALADDVATAPERPLARPKGDPLIGATVAGRFQVRELLGAGGMGTVYLAEQTAVGRTVVLKFLHAHLFRKPELKQRFHREALAASKLTCPNTIVLYDFGQTEDGMLYMAMEYLEGRALGEVIEGAGALPALRAIGITLQILSSLEEAHAKGIVHRDLKPDNIMLVSRAGTADFVKVLDFGIAKLVGSEERPAPAAPSGSEALTPLTQDGAICGSPGYMAPEQVLGGEIDHRTDLYAVGVILYQMLSGTRPFVGGSMLELLEHAAEGKVTSLYDSRPDLALPRRLDRLILRCLQKDPAARPESAAALAAELRGLTPAVARQQQEQERALMELVGIRRRWTRHLGWIAKWVAPAVGLVALVAGLWLGLARRDGSVPEGVVLALGERLFVGASAARVPPWLDAREQLGARGEARDLPERARAVRLALAEVLADLADVPPRFDAGRERDRYRGDLEQVYQHAQEVLKGDRQLVGEIEIYWVKLAVGSPQGVSYRYDAYAHAERLPAGLEAQLQRLFADLRYQRYSFLTDEAIRKRRCAEALRLGEKVKQAIADLPNKEQHRRRLVFFLELRLKPCAGPDSRPAAP